MSATAKVLLRAASRIERDGFHQGGYYPGWGDSLDPNPDWASVLREDPRPCCVLGAIGAETESKTQLMAVGDAFAQSVGLSANWDLPEWNDDPSQEQELVVAALRRAAKEAK